MTIYYNKNNEALPSAPPIPHEGDWTYCRNCDSIIYYRRSRGKANPAGWYHTHGQTCYAETVAQP